MRKPMSYLIGLVFGIPMISSCKSAEGEKKMTIGRQAGKLRPLDDAGRLLEGGRSQCDGDRKMTSNTHMASKQAATSLHVPARDIPVPSSVSPQAQAALARGRLELQEYPAPHDIAGWRSLIAASDAAVTPMVFARAAKVACEVQHTEVEHARVYIVSPPN
jgi:hypothetical protein